MNWQLSNRWSWLAFVGCLLAEFLLFDRTTSAHHAWVYPRWNDQIQYLTEAYTGYEKLRNDGVLNGLRSALVNPSAQGTMHDFYALCVFTLAGPSRSAALSVNMLAFIVWQAVLFAALVRRTGSHGLAWASAGLLLALHAPWSGNPGSAVDFRLDHMAMCSAGICISIALLCDGLRSTTWSATLGLAIGVTLVTRFLTGAYFALGFLATGLLLLSGTQPARRLANLILAGAIAALVAGPVFWLNREWVWNYYFIGHFTGPESAIRSPNMDFWKSTEFVWGNLYRVQLGPVLFALAGVLLLGSVGMRWLARREPELATTGRQDRDWLASGLIATLCPAAVLTLHAQKSELVLGIISPGVIVLFCWLAVRIAGKAADGSAMSALGIFALGVMVYLGGAAHFIRSSIADPHPAEFVSSARTVNRVADLIWRTAIANQLAAPRIGVDQVTDCLDAQVMRVVCYERHHVWVPFVMTLPTGIMAEKESLLRGRLADSDFVLLTDEMTGEGGWPYDRQMRLLYPQFKQWCDANLRKVESISLFGRKMSLYQRMAISSKVSE